MAAEASRRVALARLPESLSCERKRHSGTKFADAPLPSAVANASLAEMGRSACKKLIN